MNRKYDTFVPSALPSASLGRRRPPIGERTFGHEEGDDLDKAYHEWNVRIDKEVKAVVDGLGDLVRLADLGTPAQGAHTLTALHLKLKTASLIRASQQLRDTAHELSLALALGDDVGAAVRRDEEVGALRAEVERLRGEIAREVGQRAGGDGLDEADEAEDALEVGNGEGMGKDGEKEEKPGAAMEVDEDDEDEFEEV
ncbi:hypothetical protein CC85DRAFT_289161 [Cutaneotrichosporon oleaginosum]|uniref:Uncharacterized protein n=1 Tax=Cutaneotrichosporon oleaginosum TaxID=879819 RepID=A0A0J0XCN8_9TREE|nr:uncharacterized protein CC85DRAFT_289161 [Cutaneotrichosporon oleaginosum]KLT38835.1 hypothetical protein CC85DRAFT_289161 [Cutaneotrichosporon oleaginosum]TXT04721.1 hypothetical protein COLE_07540 [Cutaneotrichosporon oleaginosum]